MRLQTAETAGHLNAGDSLATLTDSAYRKVTVPAPSKVRRSAPLPAVVNHGRWLVECDRAGCGGAMYASEQDHRFLCPECGNADQGGQWRPVTWPTNLPAIAAVLELRLDPATANWAPGETLEELRAENLRHGFDPGRSDPAPDQARLGLRPGGESPTVEP